MVYPSVAGAVELSYGFEIVKIPGGLCLWA